MNVRPIDRLGLPGVKRSHTFLRWQRRQLARECYQAGLRREQICLWFAGYPKRRAAMSGLGRSRPFAGLLTNGDIGWKTEVPETTKTPVINVGGTANGAASPGLASPEIIAARSRADPAARVQPSGP